MSEFRSKWLADSAETTNNPPGKTGKRGADSTETTKYPTGKTGKSTSDGFAGPQVGHFAEKQWRELTPTEQQAEAAKFDERGWLAIHSNHLGEVIILARDEQAAENAPAGFVTYTGDEVGLLLGTTPDALRQVHEAKRHFGGLITSKEATTGERRDIHNDGTAQTGAGH